jgi:SpoVK/Ycf46/Vps4 family AAA+-type ATPase
MTLHGGPLAVPAHRIIALCTGQAPAPDFSARFPARRITTGLDWDGLILPGDLRQQLGHIAAWLENRRIILDDWGLSARIGPGFKALFYGPPGTGKSLTAAMLGKRTGLDVYRIDLAQVVSKYIGETEKNLGLVFDMAEERDWILFFDEADALFGTRASGASTANDRYANQEVAYLLQRIEDCPSLVILATNLKNNIDEAFFRRFQLALGFTRPDADLRRQLWTSILGRVPLAPDVDVDRLAREHPLVGGAIINIVRHATISALRRGSREVSADDIRQGIAGEMRKEGRTA